MFKTALSSALLMFPLCASALHANAMDMCTLKEPDRVLTKYGEDRAYYRDWLGACRPDGYCSANIYVAFDGNPIAYHVRVGREMFGMDYHLIFTSAAAMADGVNPIVFTIDSETEFVLAANADDGWMIEPDRSVNEYVVGQSSANQVILPAMKAGSRLSVAWVGARWTQPPNRLFPVRPDQHPVLDGSSAKEGMIWRQANRCRD